MVTGDLPASLFAAGWPRNDIAYVNAGTGAFVQRVMRTPPDDAREFLNGVANLAGIPVIRPAQSEATARGCAFLLAGCPGDWPEAGESNIFQPVADARLMT